MRTMTTPRERPEQSRDVSERRRRRAARREHASGDDPVTRPTCRALAVEEPGLGQHGEVVADRRLRLARSARPGRRRTPRRPLAIIDSRRSRAGSASTLKAAARSSASASVERARRQRSAAHLIGFTSMVAPLDILPKHIDRYRCSGVSVISTRRSIPEVPPCPESSSPSTSPTSTRPSTSTPALRHRAGQAPPGLRQLRHRRPAAEAGAHREPGDGGHAQPPRRRGLLDRRGRRRPAPPRRRGTRHRRRGRRPVATRCRTRSGSTIPTARRGRSTRSSRTARPPAWACATPATRPACAAPGRAPPRSSPTSPPAHRA